LSVNLPRFVLFLFDELDWRFLDCCEIEKTDLFDPDLLSPEKLDINELAIPSFPWELEQSCCSHGIGFSRIVQHCPAGSIDCPAGPIQIAFATIFKGLVSVGIRYRRKTDWGKQESGTIPEHGISKECCA